MDSLKIQTSHMISSGSTGEEGDRATAHQLLGAIKAAGLISRSISAEAVKSLQAVRDEKLYLHLGCASFDEFLDKHPDSPMSYYQFRQREELLAKEGDLTFQLLNTLRVPAAKRKLLTAGEVNVMGQEVEINGEKFPIANSIELRTLIVGILDEKAEVERREKQKDQTIERGRKEMERQKRRLAEAEERASHNGGASGQAPHARALVSLLGDFQLLAEEVKAIDDKDEQQRFGALALERLANAKLQLETALGFQAPDTNLGLDEADERELMDSEE
jgi:hypothetical protein